MTPCLPHRQETPAPAWRGPAGSTDCHFHIFGPYDRFPLDPGRRYDAAAASIADYRRVAEALGIERMVVVQPSIYGNDNRCTLDAVAQFGRSHACAVAVVDPGIEVAALRDLQAQGVRGLRFNLVSGNGMPSDALESLAARIAPLGLHLQIFARGDELAAMAPRIAALPVDVVIDHMGGVRTADGIHAAPFQALLRLLGEKRVWVKLSGYRISSAGLPYGDVAPFARALLAAAPERCLWGTDWPHPSLTTEVPEDGQLFDLLGDWAPTAAQRQAVLVDNPARLYGFD